MKIAQSFLAFLIVLFLGFNLQLVAQSKAKKTAPKTITNPYTGSDYKGNYVWGGAMNLAWNELKSNIIKEKIILNTTEKPALSLVNKFNNPLFAIADLDEKSYYIKSGFGQETVAAINRECKLKFHSKTFADLDFKLDKNDIISYAYFNKEVYYPIPFSKTNLTFNNQKVNAFYPMRENERDNVKILHYESDDKFIVSLVLNDESDQLILAKGYDMTNPVIVFDSLKKHQHNSYSMDEIDSFEAPILKLDMHRDYKEMVQKNFKNKGFEKFIIGEMFENIKFTMNEKGAKVEEEAVIDGVGTALNPNHAPKPKRLYLNKPFWVIMKRTSSDNPYFILGINNTELMEKVD